MFQYIAQEVSTGDYSGMETLTFGEWFHRQRQKRKLTQAAMGALVGWKASYVSKVENGHIDLPEDETRARIHLALNTTEDELVAVGILERIDSPAGGEPVYIPASSITPGERAAAAAHDRVSVPAIRVINDHESVYNVGDPRVELLHLLEGASDADVRKAIALVKIVIGAVDANPSTDLLHDIEPGA